MTSKIDLIKVFEEVRKQEEQLKARIEEKKRKIEIQCNKNEEVKRKIEMAEKESVFLHKAIKKENRTIDHAKQQLESLRKQKQAQEERNKTLQTCLPRFQETLKAKEERLRNKEKIHAEEYEQMKQKWEEYKTYKENQLPTDLREKLRSIEVEKEEKLVMKSDAEAALKQSQANLFKAQCENMQLFSKYGLLLDAKNTAVSMEMLQKETENIRKKIEDEKKTGENVVRKKVTFSCTPVKKYENNILQVERKPFHFDSKLQNESSEITKPNMLAPRTNLLKMSQQTFLQQAPSTTPATASFHQAAPSTTTATASFHQTLKDVNNSTRQPDSTPTPTPTSTTASFHQPTPTATPSFYQPILQIQSFDSRIEAVPGEPESTKIGNSPMDFQKNDEVNSEHFSQSMFNSLTSGASMEAEFDDDDSQESYTPWNYDNFTSSINSPSSFVADGDFNFGGTSPAGSDTFPFL